MLLRDLGINHRRKGTGIKELIQPYGNKDYRGMLDEWIRAQKQQQEDVEYEYDRQ
jgi:hypothetical protein